MKTHRIMATYTETGRSGLLPAFSWFEQAYLVNDWPVSIGSHTSIRISDCHTPAGQFTRAYLLLSHSGAWGDR